MLNRTRPSSAIRRPNTLSRARSRLGLRPPARCRSSWRCHASVNQPPRVPDLCSASARYRSSCSSSRLRPLKKTGSTQLESWVLESSCYRLQVDFPYDKIYDTLTRSTCTRIYWHARADFAATPLPLGTPCWRQLQANVYNKLGEMAKQKLSVLVFSNRDRIESRLSSVDFVRSCLCVCVRGVPLAMAQFRFENYQ